MATLDEVMNRPELSGFATAQERLDYLNLVTSQPKAVGLYSYSGVGDVFAENNVDISIQLDIEAFIKSLPFGGASLHTYLSSPGLLDFRLPKVQQQLQACYASLDDDGKKLAVSLMIALGQPEDVPNWRLFGLDAEPELGDIQSWLSYQRVVRYARQISNIAAGLHNLNDGKMFPDWATLKAKAIELIDNAGVEVGG